MQNHPYSRGSMPTARSTESTAVAGKQQLTGRAPLPPASFFGVVSGSTVVMSTGSICIRSLPCLSTCKGCLEGTRPFSFHCMLLWPLWPVGCGRCYFGKQNDATTGSKQFIRAGVWHDGQLTNKQSKRKKHLRPPYHR